MKYLAFYENGVLIGVGTGDESENGMEITEEEYNAILSETAQKMDYFRRVISGEIAIDDVPEKWKDEIARMATEYQTVNGSIEDEVE